MPVLRRNQNGGNYQFVSVRKKTSEISKQEYSNIIIYILVIIMYIFQVLPWCVTCVIRLSRGMTARTIESLLIVRL